MIALAAGVVAWRVLAYRTPSSMVPVPEDLRWPFAALGLFFLACGLAAYILRPGFATRLFCLQCLGAGVHWGGAIGATSREIELAVLLIYLAASALGEAALLHLALSYPQPWRTGGILRILLYAPAVFATLLAPLAAAAMLSDDVLQLVAGIVLLLANLFGVVAGVIFIVRWVRADTGTRRQTGLGIIVAAMLLATAVAWLGSGGVLGAASEAYNLALALIPASLLVALCRQP